MHSIHFFGVPGILFSISIFLAHLKVPIVSNNPAMAGILKLFLPAGHQFTYAALLSWFYALFYIKIDPFGGLLYAPILFGIYYYSVILTDRDQKQARSQSWMGTGKLLAASLLLHIFSWWIQIAIGHKVIEGAQPASLQSLGGALTVAPLFAFYEGLWLVGINKELQEQTHELVQRYTFELCTSGKVAMRACEGLSI
jgi:2-hydroxy fatty acid dioxygenase